MSQHQQPQTQPHAQPSDKVGTVRKSRKKIILGIIVLACATIGGSKWWYLQNHETTDDAQLETHVIPVVPRVSGFVEKIYVDDEKAVKVGDTLFTLDARDLEIKVRQAEADFIAAQASSKQGVAGAGVQLAESNKSTAEANQAAAKADLDKANKNAARIRELAQKEIASKQQLDDAEATVQAMQARYQAATQQVQGFGFGTISANAQVRSADARMVAAKANLDAAKLQLSYAVILAPQNGHIAKKNLEVGQLLSPNQAVMSIVMDERVWVVANFKETQLHDIKAGQDVEVDVDAYADHKFHGKVSSIQYATGSRFSLLPADNASGNFTKVVQRVPVRIEINSDDMVGYRLLPGMSVAVAIDLHSGSAQ